MYILYSKDKRINRWIFQVKNKLKKILKHNNNVIYKLKGGQQSDKERVRDLYVLKWLSHCIYILHI